MSRLSAVVVALSLMATAAATSAEAAQRAFVSSSGSDMNTASGCGLATPCRSFASAQTVVSDGGEIVALDAAGYGPITITKSVTIVANPGFYAGIAVASGHGIDIATAGVNVILRGLNINGIGGNLNDIGVYMADGALLSIENCVISNFTNGFGVLVSAPAVVRIADSLIRDNDRGLYFDSGATATISGSTIAGSTNVAVYVYGTPAGTTTTAAISDTLVTNSYLGVLSTSYTAATVTQISVTRSTISNNQYGVNAEGTGPAVLTLSKSMVTGNLNGLSQFAAGSTFESLGNNTVRQNGTNATGTITTVSGT
jgi:Right handed beta helix region